MAALRSALGPRVRELRFVLCQTSNSSQGVRLVQHAPLACSQIEVTGEKQRERGRWS